MRLGVILNNFYLHLLFWPDKLVVFYFYLWNAGLETEFSKTVLKICDPPLKISWKFFIKLVLPRKQPLNFPVGFRLKRKFLSSKRAKIFFWKRSNFFHKIGCFFPAKNFIAFFPAKIYLQFCFLIFLSVFLYICL